MLCKYTTKDTTELEKDFILSIYEENLFHMYTIGLHLFHTYPGYYMIAGYMMCKKELSYRTTLMSQRLDPTFVILLLEDPEFFNLGIKLSSSVLNDEQTLGASKFIIRKLLFLNVMFSSKNPRFSTEKKNISLGSLKTGNNLFEGNETEEEILEYMIDTLDDGDLYDYAAYNGIILKERKSINYKWYLLKKMLYNKNETSQHDNCNCDAQYIDEDLILELLKSTIEFNELELISELISPSFLKKLEVAPEYRIFAYIVKLIREGYSGDLLEQMIEELKIMEDKKDGQEKYTMKRKSLVVKGLLAVLIASKIPENLKLAFYISKKHAIDDNYEISLVNMFLARYFGMEKHLIEQWNRLSIKNIQIYNLGFIWSDLWNRNKNKKGKKLQEYSTNLIKSMKKDSWTLLDFVIKYARNNIIGHAIDMISLVKNIKKHIVCIETQNRDIKSTRPTTMFSNLLGKRCAYIFDKLTKKTQEEDPSDIIEKISLNEPLTVYNGTRPIYNVNIEFFGDFKKHF